MSQIQVFDLFLYQTLKRIDFNKYEKPKGQHQIHLASNQQIGIFLHILVIILQQIIMGKDIYLDNGKKAQGSMARYWKQQKLREKDKHKNPGTKPSHNLKNQQDDQQPITSNYDKWKAHQQNMVMKKYNKGKEQSSETQAMQIQTKPEKQVVQSHDSILKQVQEKEIIIPGYNSKSEIHKKIHKTTVIKSNTAPSSNKLVPPQLQGLFSSPEELQRILQKNKQINMQKLKFKKNKKEKLKQTKQRSQDPFQKTLQDQGYNPLKPQKQQDSEDQQPAHAQKQFFKSDILNKIAAGIQPDLKPPQQIQQQKQRQIQQPVIQVKPQSYKFIPRSVILKPQNPL